jgi:hypothetical protein
VSQKLKEKISSLEERLKSLKAQELKENQRRRTFESRKARKEDTRRKILIGSIVLARVQQGRLAESELRAWLDEALTRSDDRLLFSLSPAPAEGANHSRARDHNR